MSTIQNLEHEEALKKLKQLAEDIRVCMFCTEVYNMPFKARPMVALDIDERGCFWFFSFDDSLKNQEINDSKKVALLFSKPESAKYLVVSGKAEIIENKEKVDELWNTFAKAWFPEGKDDPRLSLIKVSTETAHYWDTKHGRMAALLHMVGAAIQGKQASEGREGDLSV